jgi:hypothetical protein
MRWVELVACEGDVYKILVRRIKGRDHLEDPEIDRRIILKWIF